MSNGNTQDLIQQIAQLLKKNDAKSEAPADSLAARLEKIEAQLSGLAKNSHPAPTGSNTHPSLQKMSMIEEIVDEIIVNKQIVKACTFEPNARPCDNCSLCSSRGF